jgi:hypothetical protein
MLGYTLVDLMTNGKVDFLNVNREEIGRVINPQIHKNQVVLKKSFIEKKLIKIGVIEALDFERIHPIENWKVFVNLKNNSFLSQILKPLFFSDDVDRQFSNKLYFDRTFQVAKIQKD